MICDILLSTSKNRWRINSGKLFCRETRSEHLIWSAIQVRPSDGSQESQRNMFQLAESRTRSQMPQVAAIGSQESDSDAGAGSPEEGKTRELSPRKLWKQSRRYLFQRGIRIRTAGAAWASPEDA